MSETNDYAGYAAWKEWKNPFTFSAEDASRFASETKGIKLADARLLEIGFGEGAFLAWAASQGAKVSGSEVTAEAIDAANSHGIALVGPDFERAQTLGARTHDVIAAFDVFEHLDAETIKAKLAAIAIALKPGGTLILRYPNGQSPFGLDPQHGDATHITPLSRAKIEQFAQGTGLMTEYYGAASAGRSPDPLRAVLRVIRALARHAIERFIRFAYATGGELSPVVTHRLVKPLGNDLADD